MDESNIRVRCPATPETYPLTRINAQTSDALKRRSGRRTWWIQSEYKYEDRPILASHMDALKFAFEILIVGALALPWLGMLIRMLCPRMATSQTERPSDSLEVFLSVVPKHARDSVGAVVIIAIGYLLGSGVSRVSRNFFNDELWGHLPTEDQIRVGVYRDEYCTANLLSDLHLPDFAIKDHPRLPEWLCAQASRGGTDKPAPFLNGKFEGAGTVDPYACRSSTIK